MPRVSKKNLFALAALAVVAAAGYWGYGHYRLSHADLKLYGSIDMRTVDLAFEESARLEFMLFEEGAQIKAGDLIAKLDESRHRIARDQAAAQVNVAKAELDLLLAGTRAEEIDVARARLKAAEANLVLSERTCKRYQDMGKASSALVRDQACYAARADRAAKEEAKRTLEMLLAGTRAEEIDVARAAWVQSQTRLADAERALRNCSLYAPSDGVIRARLKEPGDMVGANTPVYEVALMNPLWARVYIDEINLGRISMGQNVELTVDSFPDKVFEASVGFISTVAEFTPKTVQTESLRTNLVYEVRLTVNDPEGLLRLGMPVSARLLTK